MAGRTRRNAAPAVIPRAAANSESRLVGQGPGEAEAGQVGVVEAGDRADPVAGQGEDHQAVGAGDAGPGVAQVDAERGLAVGPGRDQPVGAALPAEATAVKKRAASSRPWYSSGTGGIGQPRRRRSAGRPRRPRRRPRRPRVSRLDELPLGGRVRRRGRVAAPARRSSALQGGPGALERAGHRLLGGVEDAGDLAGRGSRARRAG